MYRVSTPRREFGEISACAASQWEARSHPIVQSGSGAPDTIRTCGLYLRRVALYPAELRVLLYCFRSAYADSMRV